MEKQFTVAQTPEGKVLRPINVPYPNDDDQEEEGIFQLADAVLYKQLTADTLYIGNKPLGSLVTESEVCRIRQALVNGQWERCDEETDCYGWLPVRWVYDDV